MVMANGKNKKAKKIKRYNTRVQAKKPVARQSSLARRKKASTKTFDVTRKIILTVIVLAMMAVILALLVVFFMKPENAVIGKIEDMTKDYYEDYYYDLVLDAVPSGKDRSEIFNKYEEHGFSEVSLRRLVVLDNRKHSGVGNVIYDYCDPDETSIKIYPIAPFSRTDYRVEYNYSACIF